MLSPQLLLERGVPVYEALQEPGQFILTFPYAFCASMDTGKGASAPQALRSSWPSIVGLFDFAGLLRLFCASILLSHTFVPSPTLSTNALLFTQVSTAQKASALHQPIGCDLGAPVLIDSADFANQGRSAMSSSCFRCAVVVLGCLERCLSEQFAVLCQNNDCARFLNAGFLHCLTTSWTGGQVGQYAHAKNCV